MGNIEKIYENNGRLHRYFVPALMRACALGATALYTGEDTAIERYGLILSLLKNTKAEDDKDIPEDDHLDMFGELNEEFYFSDEHIRRIGREKREIIEVGVPGRGVFDVLPVISSKFNIYASIMLHKLCMEFEPLKICCPNSQFGLLTKNYKGSPIWKSKENANFNNPAELVIWEPNSETNLIANDDDDLSKSTLGFLMPIFDAPGLFLDVEMKRVHVTYGRINSGWRVEMKLKYKFV